MYLLICVEPVMSVSGIWCMLSDKGGRGRGSVTLWFLGWSGLGGGERDYSLS